MINYPFTSCMYYYIKNLCLNVSHYLFIDITYMIFLLQISCDMFSITLVNIDSYQASPIPELDVTFSEFRGSEIRKVPIIRIFGSTVTGKDKI